MIKRRTFLKNATVLASTALLPSCNFSTSEKSKIFLVDPSLKVAFAIRPVSDGFEVIDKSWYLLKSLVVENMPKMSSPKSVTAMPMTKHACAPTLTPSRLAKKQQV